MQSVRESRNSQLIEHILFFVDSPGGSGNIFSYKYLINEPQYWGLSVSSSASTGIASTLLRGGSTIHSTFKVPVSCNSISTCAIRPNSIEADRLRQNALFILDDRLLRDIVGNNIPFGGKTFLLGGDFRQTLPVVKKENAAQIVEQFILRSALWPCFTVSIFPVTTG